LGALGLLAFVTMVLLACFQESDSQGCVASSVDCADAGKCCADWWCTSCKKAVPPPADRWDCSFLTDEKCGHCSCVPPDPASSCPRFL